ncbi:nucleoporin NSP1-like [Gambusia affinis]|uniref:nucleoporin NSP1-like n=1 Tax=Gambusia affinis TaxID=33528 RepID=UPI001CDD673E|nr:nucleoporin NSP1-like [Gambusia affinis]
MKLLFLMVTLMTFTERSPHAWPDPTRGGSGVNLSGKMFTLSSYYGSLVFYSPYELPPWATTTSYQTDSASTPSYTQTNTGTTEMSTPYTKTKTPEPITRSYQPTTPRATTPRATTPRATTSRATTSRATTPRPTTTTHRTTTTTHRTTTTTHRTTTRHPWTTAPSTRGVSVCLRYVTDSDSGSIFTLSPSSQYLRLEISRPQLYMLTFNNYNTVYLQPYLKLWSGLTPNVWTSICFTLDNTKGVVQMFRDSYMSSRKLLNNQYVWSGERVMQFSNFQGQLTDVQVWDYPLRYQEVLYYMSSGGYGSYQGSVLSWSYISYSQTGRTLLEDGYELQMKKPNRKWERRNHQKGGFKPRKVFLFEESKREQWKKEM